MTNRPLHSATAGLNPWRPPALSSGRRPLSPPPACTHRSAHRSEGESELYVCQCEARERKKKDGGCCRALAAAKGEHIARAHFDTASSMARAIRRCPWKAFAHTHVRKDAYILSIAICERASMARGSRAHDTLAGMRAIRRRCDADAAAAYILGRSVDRWMDGWMDGWNDGCRARYWPFSSPEHTVCAAIGVRGSTASIHTVFYSRAHLRTASPPPPPPPPPPAAAQY